MRKELFSNPYFCLEYDEKKRIFYTTHFPDEEKNMTDEIYKNAVYEVLKYTAHYQPLYYLENALDLSYPVSPQLQLWTIHTLVPKWIGMGLRKYAQIMPTDFISRLAMEQTVESATENFMNISNMPIETAYFTDEQSAVEWLLKA